MLLTCDGITYDGTLEECLQAISNQLDNPAQLKEWAIGYVNQWANKRVMDMHILEPELFYVAMVSNVAFRLLEWHAEGEPQELDSARYIITHSEAQAYREAHAGHGTPEETLTPYQLINIQDGRWSQMQAAFASIVFDRRFALETIKLAPPGPDLPDRLSEILATLPRLT